MEVAKSHREQLPRLKKFINSSHIYFQPNVKRYNEFRKEVFDTGISDEDQSLLISLKKPVIEFNIQEMFISRLRGEFSKQEPSIVVMPDDGAEVNEAVLKTVEGHIRHAFSEANNNNCQYDIYTDLLSGGFSVLKIWTEYAHEMSMNQVIKFGRVFDPTLTGFDPLARYSHKGDGRYCFEFFPKSAEEFHKEYPDYDMTSFSYARTEDDFNWSYKDQKENIVILCDFYEKKKKKVKIYKIADGTVKTEKQYEQMLEEHNAAGHLYQPPAIVGKGRWTDIETICRYRMCENEVLEYEETDFKHLPLIFVDGNSILIRDSDNNAVRQMCRPYVYHTRGTQKLKNFAGQTLAAFLENMVMHKFKVAKESLPEEEEYLEAYGNMQIASTFVYNAFMDNEPDKPIPPPQEIQLVPTPPEVAGTFQMMDSLTQTILGSFDASLGINDNQLSGIAIFEGATQSNSAAMPYVVGFMQAFNQLAKVYVNLLPKYYITPRTIPVVGMDGKRTYKKINQPNQQDSVSFNYDENALSVKVEAGVSFNVQKARALSQIIALQQASPLFAQFMATEGLDVLLDNIEFHGSEIVKQKADKWMQMMKQQQAQAAQQPNPEQVKMQLAQAKMQSDSQAAQLKFKEHEDQLAFDRQKLIVDSHLRMDEMKTKKQVESMKAAHNIHEHHLKKHDTHMKHNIEHRKLVIAAQQPKRKE